MIAPGTYLRLRREAAGLTLDDVALAIRTDPPLPALSRAEWLGQIESGVYPLLMDVVVALEACPGLLFDRDVLFTLVAAAAGLHHHEKPRICRACGCSEWTACLSPAGAPCGWADADLCTACAPAGLRASAVCLDEHDPCACDAHCCCCGPGEPCCDCGEIMPARPETREPDHAFAAGTVVVRETPTGPRASIWL